MTMPAPIASGGEARPIAVASDFAGRVYRPRQAFLPQPDIPHRYRLRFARYTVLAQDIDAWAGSAAAAGGTLSLLDCGCGWGGLFCCLDTEPHAASIDLAGADRIDQVSYKRGRYREFFVGDLTAGYPEIPSDAYDVVVCEQVLEHLDRIDRSLATLVRLVRPGGVLVVGVPIFFPPLHLARRHLVPQLARLIPRLRESSHVQAFSLFSFRRLLRGFPELHLVKVRGFRIASGGMLRPLEKAAWWWRFNRRLGDILPALCIEAQFILLKAPRADGTPGVQG